MDNPFIKYNKSNDYVMGDLKKLSSSYIPDNFPHREKQIDGIGGSPEFMAFVRYTRIDY